MFGAHDELIFLTFSVMFELPTSQSALSNIFLLHYQLLTSCLLTRQLLLQNAHLRKQRALVNSSMSKISSLQKQNGKLGWNVWHEPRVEALATRGPKLKNSNKRLGATNWSLLP